MRGKQQDITARRPGGTTLLGGGLLAALITVAVVSPGTLGTTLVGANYQAPTELTAHPALAQVNPPRIYFPNVTATLTTGSPAVPVAGETLTFTTDNQFICGAVTGADGIASCSGLLKAPQIILGSGYTATFAGTSTLAPSSDQGEVIRL